jgi:hypothetical protein
LLYINAEYFNRIFDRNAEVIRLADLLVVRQHRVGAVEAERFSLADPLVQFGLAANRRIYGQQADKTETQ